MKKHYTPLTFIAVSFEEMNAALEYCDKYRVIKYDQKPANEEMAANAYIEDKTVEFTLTYRRGPKCQTLVFRKDGGEFIQRNGLEAFRILNKYYNIPRAKFPCSDGQHSEAGYLYNNPKLSGHRYENCYGYDINSAYTAAMCEDMPDTRYPAKIGKCLEEGEIGFRPDYRITTQVGMFCMYVYPRIESPFKKFAEVWYAKKKNATNKADKAYAKAILNCAVGYLQRVNPVLRTAILSYANQRIMSLVDENTLYCNTDSIISRVRRPDIEKNLGPGLGQWKIEHQGAFAYIGFSAQWNNDLPIYRGIPKAWFSNGWDILKDPLPDIDSNIFYYDKAINRIRRKEDGKTEEGSSAES